MFSHAALNATLNAISAILLAGGYAAIRAGKREAHKRFMISAFVVSCAFLVSYLVYHYRVGHVAFQGQGIIRPVYFALLISHTILAAVIVPLILITLRRAWLERFDKHRVIARWTLPLWFYVSVTGVVVYLMLYQIYRPERVIESKIEVARSLLSRVTPQYPAEARAKGIRGTVRMKVLIAIDGTVAEVHVLSGEPLLAQAATTAVRQWRYDPKIVNGKPVEVDSGVDMIFAF